MATALTTGTTLEARNSNLPRVPRSRPHRPCVTRPNSKRPSPCGMTSGENVEVFLDARKTIHDAEDLPVQSSRFAFSSSPKNDTSDIIAKAHLGSKSMSICIGTWPMKRRNDDQDAWSRTRVVTSLVRTGYATTSATVVVAWRISPPGSRLSKREARGEPRTAMVCATICEFATNQ